ncbi:MAG: alkaline phosphatase family protein [Gemmatales bacterium]|nr:MAG: alkaline phosphatase family protein [Gemmatales bacterium]
MLVVVNTVGLTGRLLPLAPRLHALAQRGWVRPLREILPAVTSSVQATFLTGTTPETHGIVANGWLFRDTGEIRFWQQSNRLIQAEPLYQTLKRRYHEQGKLFRCAKLFWWFNQGANVDVFVTPKPYYGADGNKIFGILGSPPGLTDRMEQKLGKFPFHTFWGPLAGLPCSQWIALAAADVLREYQPDLLLVYLPHLDYDTQRYGPAHCDLPRLCRELDDACEPLLEAARTTGARVAIVNECCHVDVSQPIFPNRALRQAGLLTCRDGPFGESLDTFQSEAFAVCDHQIAHIYINDRSSLARVREIVAGLPGVARVLTGEERSDIRLDHPRAGELIALAQPDSWFAYPYWLDDRRAPDFARTVDIHRKPGYDPCELFFDPELWWPKGKVLLRLMQKKLGFRMLLDVVPLDARLVRGSHGLAAYQDIDRPIMIGDGPAPTSESLDQTEVYHWFMQAFAPNA